VSTNPSYFDNTVAGLPAEIPGPVGTRDRNPQQTVLGSQCDQPCEREMRHSCVDDDRIGGRRVGLVGKAVRRDDGRLRPIASEVPPPFRRRIGIDFDRSDPARRRDDLGEDRTLVTLSR
jgi:hypothetical protein